jgi:hypothetical protein
MQRHGAMVSINGRPRVDRTANGKLVEPIESTRFTKVFVVLLVVVSDSNIRDIWSVELIGK